MKYCTECGQRVEKNDYKYEPWTSFYWCGSEQCSRNFEVQHQDLMGGTMTEAVIKMSVRGPKWGWGLVSPGDKP